MSRKVGLLLPRSVIYPSIGFDMAGGLRAGFESAGLTDVVIKTESIGVGADDKIIYAACEQLLFDGITVIAGYVNPMTAEKLEPLFASANALFIALDAGYHFPSSTKKLPHIFYISLQGALCIRTAMRAAMEEGIKDIAYSCSFYESGYRSTFAVHGGVAKGGGNITGNFIAPLKKADFTLQPLIDHLGSTASDALFVSVCGDMVQELFAAAAANDVFKVHRVYGSSFTGDEQWLSKSPYPGVDVKVCVPWASELTSIANTEFAAQLKLKNINENIFSLLGWESAQVISKVIDLPSGQIINALEGFAFDSPRGAVTLDAETHQCHAPVYDAWIKKEEATGNCVLVPEKSSPYTEEERAALENDINNITGAMTSWANVYGCLDS